MKEKIKWLTHEDLNYSFGFYNLYMMDLIEIEKERKQRVNSIKLMVLLLRG